MAIREPKTPTPTSYPSFRRVRFFAKVSQRHLHPKNAKVKPSEHHSALANSPTPASLGASAPVFFFAKDTNRTDIEGREAGRGEKKWAEEAGRGGQRGLMRRAEAGRRRAQPRGEGQCESKPSEGHGGALDEI